MQELLNKYKALRDADNAEIAEIKDKARLWRVWGLLKRIIACSILSGRIQIYDQIITDLQKVIKEMR